MKHPAITPIYLFLILLLLGGGSTDAFAQFKHDRLERAVFQFGPYIRFQGKTPTIHKKSWEYLNYVAEVLKTDYTRRKLVIGVRGKTEEMIASRSQELEKVLKEVYKVPPDRFEMEVCPNYKRKRDDPWLAHSKSLNLAVR